MRAVGREGSNSVKDLLTIRNQYNGDETKIHKSNQKEKMARLRLAGIAYSLFQWAIHFIFEIKKFRSNIGKF